MESQTIHYNSPESRTCIQMFLKGEVVWGWGVRGVGLSGKALFTDTFVCMLFTDVAVLRGVDLLGLLICITDSIHGTEDYKSLHGGPHVGQSWSRITGGPACSYGTQR